MFRNRIFPCLLFDNDRLVKTVNFKNPKYIGDPVNAIKIYSELEVDEIVLLDITASEQKRIPNFDKIEKIVEETFCPMSYGGGVNSIEIAKEIIRRGCEKVILNSYAFENPDIITKIANDFGSQCIVVSIDVKKNLFGKYKIFTNSGKKETSYGIVEFAKLVEKLGAGEIFLQSIDRDGSWKGYDLKLIKMICDNTTIPVSVCGGASCIEDFMMAIKNGANGCAAGSMAVYSGKDMGVLINFPSDEIKENWYDLSKMYLR